MRQRRKNRHKAENSALTRAMQAAGIPRAIAKAECRRMHGEVQELQLMNAEPEQHPEQESPSLDFARENT